MNTCRKSKGFSYACEETSNLNAWGHCPEHQMLPAHRYLVALGVVVALLLSAQGVAYYRGNEYRNAINAKRDGARALVALELRAKEAEMCKKYGGVPTERWSAWVGMIRECVIDKKSVQK